MQLMEEWIFKSHHVLCMRTTLNGLFSSWESLQLLRCIQVLHHPLNKRVTASSVLSQHHQPLTSGTTSYWYDDWDYTYFAITSVVETTEEESTVWRLLVCFEPPRVGAPFPVLVEQTFMLQALLSTCLPSMCSACPSPKPLLHFTAFRLLALRTLNFILQFKIITTHSCIYLIRKNESLCFMW